MCFFRYKTIWLKAMMESIRYFNRGLDLIGSIQTIKTCVVRCISLTHLKQTIHYFSMNKTFK